MKIALLIIVALLSGFVSTKTMTQRHRFYKDDFFYSTKFGVPANSYLTIKYKAKILAYGDKESEMTNVYFDLAVYQDDKWDQLQDNPSMSCSRKKQLATTTQ
jgi:hypothetical protein